MAEDYSMSKEEGKQWSTKHRPYELDDVVGNENAKKKVRSQLERRTTHCILITGESGCGKSTFAKILADGFSGNVDADVEWINAASDGQIDKIRSLVERVKFLPRKKNRVVIVDEAHALTGASKSALLIPVETPSHSKIVWVFCTNKPWLLADELLNRCYKIAVEKPEMGELARLLLRVVKEEKAFRKLEKDDIKKIVKEVAKAADFVPREALQLLQGAAEGGGDVASVVGRIRQGESASIDKAALQVIMALVSQKKSLDFRRNYLVQQLASQDAYAMLNRLTVVCYAILCDVHGHKVPASYYYNKELKPMDAYPNPLVATLISARLADLKERLTQINLEPAHLIVPELIILQEVITKKMQNEDGEDE